MSKQENPPGAINSGVESRRLRYRLRRSRFSDHAVYPGERNSGHDPALTRQLADREKQVKKLTADNTSLRDLALRARAELENARKRLEREKAEAIKYANERLVGELVGVVDNLERGLESAADIEEAKPLHDGIRMVMDQFLGVLSSNGLEVIAPDGQHFNPHFHEAVAAEEREDVEDNVILGTFQKGYVLRGRVVRPAMVRVARAAPRPEPSAEAVPAPDPDSVETLADIDEASRSLEAAETGQIVDISDMETPVPESGEEQPQAEKPAGEADSSGEVTEAEEGAGPAVPESEEKP